MIWSALAFVGLAGLASVIRWELGLRLPRPFATMVVNVVGAGLLGWVSTWSSTAAAIVGIGALGSLTTFSTFIDDALVLSRKSPAKAVAYIVASLALGLIAALFGRALAS